MLWRIAAAIVLFGVLLVSPVTGDSDDLVALAAYFPENTGSFLALRTDDDAIDRIDQLIDRLNEPFERPVLPFSLRQLLDTLVATSGGDVTFATTIRPWLGDGAAVGIFGLEGATVAAPNQWILALRTQGRAVFEDWLTGLPRMAALPRDEGADYTLYTLPAEMQASDEESLRIFVREDVVLLSNSDHALPPDGPRRTLADSAQFQTAVSRLPAPDYNIVFYNDLVAMSSWDSVLTTAQLEAAGLGWLLPADDIAGATALADTFSAQVFGLTQQDDTHLILDGVLVLDVASWRQSLGLLFLPEQPTDTALAAHLPADAMAVVFGMEVGRNLPDSALITNTAARIVSDPARFRLGLNQFLRDLQRTTLRALPQFFDWADGRYAWAFGVDTTALTAADDASPQRIAEQFSLVIENTDAGAQTTYDTLVALITAYAEDQPGVTIEEKPLATGQAFNISLGPEAGLTGQLNLQLALTDAVLAFGTPAYVQAAVRGERGLDQQPAFSRAAGALFPEPLVVLMLNTAPISTLLDASAQADFTLPFGIAEFPLPPAVLDLVESSTLSLQQLAEDSVTLRAVLTLTP